MTTKILEALKKLEYVLSKEQKVYFWFVFVAAFVSALFETVGVSVIVPLVNAMLTPEELFEYKWLKPFLRLFSIQTNKQIVILIVIATIGLYLFKNLYGIFVSWLKAKYASKVQRECSVFMMKSYMNRGYIYFLNKNSNEIIQGVVGDVQGVYNIINCILYSTTKVLIVVMIGIYMFASDWMMASSLIITATICLLVIMKFFKKPMREVGNQLRDYTIDANQVLLQSVQGIKEVMVMRKQLEFVAQYEGNMVKRQKADIKRCVYTDTPNNIVEAFCISAIMIVLCIKMIGSSNTASFIAILASFAVGAFRIMPSIGYISSSFNSAIASLASLDNVYQNMQEARKFANQFSDIDKVDNEQYVDFEFKNQLQIRDVSFSYSEELGNVLDHISLDIERNSSVAFVGESGAGKSTLADVILGILPIKTGAILLDEIDISEIPNKWSSLIGFVPQNIFLCDLSIAENVAFGVKKAEIDIEKVRKVLEMANVLSFIDTLPNTIWTEVGDRGVRLSGGQRQRIGIARALYNSPQILILDEATSALDNDTEKSVMEAIETLQGNITLIIIAHRLSTIKNCNKIYEIKKGKAYEREYRELV